MSLPTSEELEAQYKERLNYEGFILNRIDYVCFLLDNKINPHDQMDTLLSTLLPEIKEAIKDKVKAAKTEQSQSFKQYQRRRNYNEKDYNGVDMTDNERKFKIYQKYTLTVIELIFSELKKKGLLISLEKQVDRGGY